MKKWPRVKLGEVLQLDLHKEPIDISKGYEMVGVLSFGRGLFRRETIENGNTSYKYFLRLSSEHVVMSQLFGWEGALALSSDDFEGCYVSPQFPTFLCDQTRLNRNFLGWVMQQPSFWDDLGSRAKGMGDRRRTLNPDSLFASYTPLPPIDKQKSIVARLDQLAGKIRQVNEHLAAAEHDAFRLLILMATRRDLSDEQRIEMGWKETTIGHFTKLALFPVKVDANEAYPNIGIYNFARGLFEKPPIEGTRTSAKTLYQIRNGQFIYSRLFAFEGAYALVPPEYDGYYVSNEFPTFDIDLEKATPSFLITLFLTEQDWQELAMSSKGVGDRRLRIQPDKILHRKVWLPPLEDQKRIEKLFDAYHALKAKHAKIRGANQALIPATLERLFSSEGNQNG